MSDDLTRGDDPQRERFRQAREDRPLPERPRRLRDERDDDTPAPPSGDGGTRTLFIILGVVAVVGFCLVSGVVGGFIYIVVQARSAVTAAAARMQTTNNFKQVALGIHAYHDRHNALPPVAMKTRDGKPGLSWRVAILPFIEQDALYRQFNLDKGWEDPDNMKLATQMPYIYAPDRSIGGDKTHMRVFVGNRAMFDLKNQGTFMQVKDGLSNTLMVVEASDPVLWIKPDELPFDPKGKLPSLGMPQNDYFIAVFGDGSARPIRKSVNSEKLKLAIDSGDGQWVDLDN